MVIQDKQEHRQEVRVFLQRHFQGQSWELAIPAGTGNETYIAHGSKRDCFVKLGAQAARYKAVASIGLAAPLLADGFLEDGSSIIVQPYIAGRRPSHRDYRIHLEEFATAITRVHLSPEVKWVLPPSPDDRFSVAGMEALDRIQQRWERHKAQVPGVSGFVDESLDHLRKQVVDFQGTGLVASHNDICNYNWLLSSEGRLYLVDLESMSLDDPALDIGATLWWYYPPGLRESFLKIAGYAGDKAFKQRMQVRMAMHCLHITLPRENSFDEFDPTSFDEELNDFRAILARKDNPQGYED
jgi:thiamine kinase-like enzyme